jgi:hypothetical protein
LAFRSNYSASSGGVSSSSRRSCQSDQQSSCERPSREKYKRLFNGARDFAPARVNPMIRAAQSPQKGHRALQIFFRKRTSIMSLREMSLFGHGTEDMRDFPGDPGGSPK